MRRAIAATLAAALLAACSSPAQEAPPAEQAPPPAPASTPAATTPTPTGPPTLSRWVGVDCTPVGATAKTTSGGDLVCRKAGSDPGPKWHAGKP